MPVLKNQRHERFAQEVAKGKSAGAAYLAAGYKSKASTAETNGPALLRKPQVKARVDELLAGAAAKAQVTIEKVLRELSLLGFANMEDYMRVGPDGDPVLDYSKLTRDQAAALTEVTVEDFKDGRGEDARDVRRVKFKLADKRAALVDIGKHLGMFVEKHEHGGPGGGPIPMKHVVETVIVDPRKSNKA